MSVRCSLRGQTPILIHIITPSHIAPSPSDPTHLTQQVTMWMVHGGQEKIN